MKTKITIVALFLHVIPVVTFAQLPLVYSSENTGAQFNSSFETVNGIGGTEWQWSRLTSTSLKPGSHTITIAYREDGAKMDKILITTSNNSMITAETAGTNCK